MIMNLQNRTDVLYRYVDRLYSCFSDDEYYHGEALVRIVIEEYPVVRRTDQGAWIRKDHATDSFVLLTARKKFACNTKQEAYNSFLARKKRQIGILTGRLRRAKEALAMAESMELYEI
jgi:hypothetical protein